MKDAFARPHLGQTARNLLYLLKHTVLIAGRDRDILVPPLKMGFYATLPIIAFFAAIWAIAAEAGNIGTALLAVSLVLFVYKFFYYTRQELALSWLVHEVAAGRSPSAGDATREVRRLKGQSRVLALLDMAAAWIAWQRRKGKKGIVSRVLLSALTEGWDMVNHFLLPVFAIEGGTLRQAMSRLAAARENVPETLVGVFGIDIFARLVLSVAAPLYAVVAVLGLIAGVAFAPVLPSAFGAGEVGQAVPAQILAYLPLTAESQFNWMPLFTGVFCARLAAAMFERLVTTLKVIYFTLFYTRVMHPQSLSADMGAELDPFLHMSDESDGMAPVPA